MSGLRTFALVGALVSLGVGVAGCGQVVGFKGASPPSHTKSYPSESAAPLPAGVDAESGLLQRAMRPPAPAGDGNCWASSSPNIPGVLPDYGAGVGPTYLSGQTVWYSAGQAAILMVDSKYSGPLLIRPFQLGGSGTAAVTLSGFSSLVSGFTDKERSHGNDPVPAVQTSGGGLFIAAVAQGSSWRTTLGTLSTDSAGCFGLQVDGDRFTEFIVFEVNPGTPPPG